MSKKKNEPEQSTENITEITMSTAYLGSGSTMSKKKLTLKFMFIFFACKINFLLKT